MEHETFLWNESSNGSFSTHEVSLWDTNRGFLLLKMFCRYKAVVASRWDVGAETTERFPL